MALWSHENTFAAEDHKRFCQFQEFLDSNLNWKILDSNLNWKILDSNLNCSFWGLLELSLGRRGRSCPGCCVRMYIGAGFWTLC